MNPRPGVLETPGANLPPPSIPASSCRGRTEPRRFRTVPRTVPQGPQTAWLCQVGEVSKTVSGGFVRRGFKSLPLRLSSFAMGSRMSAEPGLSRREPKFQLRQRYGRRGLTGETRFPPCWNAAVSKTVSGGFVRRGFKSLPLRLTKRKPAYGKKLRASSLMPLALTTCAPRPLGTLKTRRAGRDWRAPPAPTSLLRLGPARDAAACRHY